MNSVFKWALLVGVIILMSLSSINVFFQALTMFLLPMTIWQFFSNKGYQYGLPLGVFLGGVTLVDKISTGTLGNAVGTGLVVALLIWVISYYIGLKRNSKGNKKETVVPKAKEDKIAQYKKAGLSNEEIEFFRETMATVQKQIKAWEVNIHKNAKLQAIELRTKGCELSKKLFKEIVAEPNRMNAAGEFIHQHLPNMQQLSTTYIEIANHASKNAETLTTLKEASEVIAKLSEKIGEDYRKFISRDIDDLEVQLELAKKNLRLDDEVEASIKKMGDSMDEYSSLLDLSGYLDKNKEKV